MDLKQIGKIAGIAGVGVLLGGAGMYVPMSNNYDNGVASVEPTVEIQEVEVEKEVEVEVEVEVIKEVEVDNGKLALVLDHIYDNSGDVEYLTEDLDDDEIAEIADRVVFVNDIKAMALAEVEKEGVDELDGEDVEEEELDEDDIERFRVYDDDDEIEVLDVDFEDKDAKVKLQAKFEQDDVKYVADFIIDIRDGEVNDIDVRNIELRD